MGRNKSVTFFLVWLAVMALSSCSGGPESWVRLLGSAHEEVATALVVAEDGTTYLTGTTGGGLAEDPARGGVDIFVASYSASGDLEWKRTYGSPGDDLAEAITRDKNGNLYLTGNTNGSLDGHTDVKDDQVFVMKLAEDGELQWARVYGETSDAPINATLESGRGIAVDEAGAIYVTGYTINSFGKAQSESYDRDIFLLKLGPDGEPVDQMVYGTPRDDAAHAIAVRNDATIYLAGETTGSLGQDEGQKNASEGVADAFVMQVGQESAWTRLLGTSGVDVANSLAVDEEGNVWISGNASFGLGEEKGLGGGDGFAAHFDAQGNLRWSRLIGGSSIDQSSALALDSDGENLYVTGFTWSDLDRPAAEQNTGLGNAYVVRLNAASGEKIAHAVKKTAEQTDWGRAIGLDRRGRIFVAGSAGGAIDKQKHAGGNDILLWKLDRSLLEPRE